MPDRAFIDQLEDTWTGTAAVCRELTPGEWDRATACPGWTVRDQVSHMVGTESMLLGRPSPPAVTGDLAHVLNAIGELNEAWVEARRRLPGQEVLAEFEEVTAARLAALRTMSDEDLEALTPSPIGRVPYATFMDVRVMDCWVHEQDIRRAVDRPGHLSGPAATASLARLLGSFPYVVGKRVAPPDGTAVVLELTGPVARTISVGIRDGRAVALDDRPPEPTAWIITDSGTYACLVAGRLRGADATGAVAVHGDEELGRAIVDNLATIP
jgi:uncharacterized protein (TIGR03083 family)